MLKIHFPHVSVLSGIVSRVTCTCTGYNTRRGRRVLSACITMQRLLSAVVLYSPSLRPRLSLHKLASYHSSRVRLLAAPRSYSRSLHLGSSLSLAFTHSSRHVSTLRKPSCQLLHTEILYLFFSQIAYYSIESVQ